MVVSGSERRELNSPKISTAVGSEMRSSTNSNRVQALHVVQRVEKMCCFVGHPAMRAALEQVPVTMPHDLAALGLETPFWVGLGTVALWAALDAFAARVNLKGKQA